MPSSGLGLATTGIAECEFVEALLSSTRKGQAAIPAILARGSEYTSNELPGTDNKKPDSIDLDGFAAVLSFENFAEKIPKVFNVVVGGASKPPSSKKLLLDIGCAYVGTINGNIHLHVPRGAYISLYKKLRCCKPAPSAESPEASKTNVKTFPMVIFLGAMQAALEEEIPSLECRNVVVNCYGLEDPIDGTESSGVKILPHQEYVADLLDSSVGFRMDVAAVWNARGATLYLSVPGKASGLSLYAIGVPLQSASSFMEFLKSDPTSSRAESYNKRGGWKGGTLTARSAFLLQKAASSSSGLGFRICSGAGGNKKKKEKRNKQTKPSQTKPTTPPFFVFVFVFFFFIRRSGG